MYCIYIYIYIYMLCTCVRPCKYTITHAMSHVSYCMLYGMYCMYAMYFVCMYVCM